MIASLEMKTEIEKIIRADETALQKEEAGRAEAQKIRAQAKKEAEKLIEGKKRELMAAVGTETEKIFSEARSKAEKIEKETDDYLEGLRSRKQERWDDLMNLLLKKVIGD